MSLAERAGWPPASAGATAVPSALAFAGNILVIGVTFRALGAALARSALLEPSAYADPVMTWGLLERVARLLSARVSPVVALSAGVALVLAGVVDLRWYGGEGRRRLRAWTVRVFAGWEELDDGRALRGLVLAVTAVSAWVLSAYPPNLYLDQGHLADRLLLLALWLAIGWRPIATLPFALVAHVIGGQFVVPLGGISWTEMEVVLHFPVLFGAFWMVRGATGDRQGGSFVFAWCCVLAATYWSSGLGKLHVDWLSHPQVHLLFLGAHANGWLGTAGTEAINAVARSIATLARPLMFVTVLIECGALLLLWRRWSLIGFIVLAAGFHVGAFALTGIFFWKWLLVHACLLAYLFRSTEVARRHLFTPGRFALSVVIIGTAPAWMSAQNLTWYDTPLTYSLRLEGVAEDGTSYPLPPGFFRPFSEALVLGTFPTISPHVQLTSAMAVTKDRALAEALVDAPTAEAILLLEQERGTPRFREDAARAFDALVARYAEQADCAARREPILLRLLAPPRHLWTQPLDAVLPCGVQFTRVRVHELTIWYDGSALRTIRSRVIREIDVARARPAPPS